jgi:DMSO/TMAO reductase YedYZ molybdopterin-dependent catalytic subunit
VSVAERVDELVPEQRDFPSRLHHPRVAARIGAWLGICFFVAFATGVLSHLAQDPNSWLPTQPIWGYRVTQGVHVAAGTAAVPLLLAKLWTVYPRFWIRPPKDSKALALHAAERGSIGLLVAAAIFQLATGLMNASQWYPWSFSFRATHFAVAWLAVGALALHIAVKLPVIRAAYQPEPPEHREPEGDGLSRRGLVRTAGLASVAAVVLTAGSTVPWLRKVSVFGVRSGNGPGGVPINKSAKAAGVTASATDPAYRLEIAYGARSLSLARTDLEALTQRTSGLPIACVEGWSAQGQWTGVRLRELLDLVEAPRGATVEVTSLQASGPFRVTHLPGQFADDDLTLIALGLDGEALSIDHGYPARLIAPNRPGVLQTKWVSRLEVQT